MHSVRQHLTIERVVEKAVDSEQVEVHRSYGSPCEVIVSVRRQGEGFVGEKGSGDSEEIIIRDLELDMVQQMRDDWQFYRDRRPDAYGDLVRP